MKDPWLAVFLSSIFPGMGQIYSESKPKGYFFIGVQIGLAVSSTASILAILYGFDPLIPVLLVLASGIFSFCNLFDAYKSAKQFNHKWNFQDSLLKKEPFLAVFLSSLFPGLGQFYNSKIWKGIGFIILFFSLSFLATIIEQILYIDVLFKVGVEMAMSLFILHDAYFDSQQINGNQGGIISCFEKRKVYSIIGLWLFLHILPAGTAGIIRSNFVMPYKLPAQSMRPTLDQGDRIFVNKWIYKHENPKRGDLVVFQYPFDPKKDFLKRVVGMPGEKLKIQDGHIYINGELLTAPEFLKENYYNNREDWRYGKSGMVIEIPENFYFVLGDNSAQSSDSRNYGFIPRKAIKAKAFFIWWPLNRWGKLQ